MKRKELMLFFIFNTMKCVTGRKLSITYNAKTQNSCLTYWYRFLGIQQWIINFERITEIMHPFIIFLPHEKRNMELLEIDFNSLSKFCLLQRVDFESHFIKCRIFWIFVLTSEFFENVKKSEIFLSFLFQKKSYVKIFFY